MTTTAKTDTSASAIARAIASPTGRGAPSWMIELMMLELIEALAAERDQLVKDVTSTHRTNANVIVEVVSVCKERDAALAKIEALKRALPKIFENVAFSAFMRSFYPNNEDGGPTDWANDTRPHVLPWIDDIMAELFREPSNV